MKRFDGRVALVFGAGSAGPGWGNGKASAVAYAREGAAVVAVDYRLDAAEETAAIIRGEGGAATAIRADVTRAAEVEAAVAAALGAHGGRLDILHNNVGITAKGGVLEESEASWRRVFDTNATSMFLAIKAALPAMLARGAGAIVNVSSVASIRWTGYPYLSYSASKAAVNQLTVAVALEHGKSGIRCNAILPGLMDTPMIREQIVAHYPGGIDEMIAKRNAQSPTGRMGTAWDIANAAVFLASDEAGYINGVCLPVDGGLSQQMGS